jgi:hypothetical protein
MIFKAAREKNHKEVSRQWIGKGIRMREERHKSNPMKNLRFIIDHKKTEKGVHSLHSYSTHSLKSWPE